MSGILLPVVAGLGCAGAAFAVAWWWAREIDNYSWVDAFWATGIGITGISWLMLLSDRTPKHVLAALLLAIWSGRLAWHLQKRIRRMHPVEDPRYEELRRKFGKRVSLGFLALFEIQAVSVVIQALPFLLIAVDPDGRWGLLETCGTLVALGGVAGESLADAQMARFKESHDDPNAVCREGLWKWSRHPNYFFEFVIWIGFYVFACGSQWGWVTLHAPLIILYLLLRVTGIPPTEASALRRKGDAYRDYQNSTSAFIPLPPKTN